MDEGSLLRKAKRDNVQALRIMKSCLWHSEIIKLSFYPPQRISSRSDFIPLGISSVSPILETDLIAAKGRCPLSLTIRLILLRQILGILPHIGGRYSRLPLKGLVKVCGVVKAAGKGDFKQGHMSARGNEANCLLDTAGGYIIPKRDSVKPSEKGRKIVWSHSAEVAQLL